MESNKIDDNKEKIENEINTSSKIETSPKKPKKPRKKLVQEYAARGLDICGVCKKKI